MVDNAGTINDDIEATERFITVRDDSVALLAKCNISRDEVDAARRITQLMDDRFGPIPVAAANHHPGARIYECGCSGFADA